MRKWLEDRIAEADAERDAAIKRKDNIGQAYWGGRHSAYEASLRELHLRDERITIEQLVDIAVLPVDIAVLAALASAAPLTDADITRAAVTATVTYLVECGLVTPCLDSEVPDLLPMRVGQPPASLQGDLRALLDLPDGPGDGGEW